MTSVRSSRGGSYVPRRACGRFEFLVCDWSLMRSSPGAKTVSQEFVMSDSSVWSLRIFPGGSNSRQAGFVSVHMAMIGLGNNVGSATATFKISVLGRNSKRQVHDPQVDKIYSLKSPSAMIFSLDSEEMSLWTIDNFLLAQDLEENYADNDAVLFALDIEVLGKPELLYTTMPPYTGPLGTLAEDFGGLLDDANEAALFSDITLVADQKKMRCHKSILAARSEVLKKKFQSSTFQTRLLFNSGHYHLEDMTADVLQEMVRFIYTDCCSDNVMATKDRSLLVAAVRFKLPRLIQMCEDHIGETLTPSNVVETLNLACELKSERLDVCCSEFISAHQEDVQASKTLCDLHPDALKDLIAKSILPASTILLASGTKNAGPVAKDEESEEVKDNGIAVDESLASKLKGGEDYIPEAGTKEEVPLPV